MRRYSSAFLLLGAVCGVYNSLMAIVVNSRTKLTYQDYVQFPMDGRRHEIVDGEHVVTPAPETYHQHVFGGIFSQLFPQIQTRGLGSVFAAPTDVELSEVDVVQPDAVIVLEAHRQIVTPTKIKGVPDLVIEILSPSTQERDRGLKLELYRKAGIPEYWIVDPGEHCVEQWVLERGGYVLRAKESPEISPLRPEGVRVDLTQVW